MSLVPPPSAPDVARDLSALRVRLAACAEAAALRPLGLGGLLLGPGVIADIADVVAEVRRDGDVVLLADRREMAGAAGEVKAFVAGALTGAGMTVRHVTLGDERADVHADALTLRRATTAAAGAGAVVSVGSGTIADIGKALSASSAASRT